MNNIQILRKMGFIVSTKGKWGLVVYEPSISKINGRLVKTEIASSTNSSVSSNDTFLKELISSIKKSYKI